MSAHWFVNATEDSEETRAYLQTRLALFWKVLFFFNLAGGILGLAGAAAGASIELPSRPPPS